MLINQLLMNMQTSGLDGACERKAAYAEKGGSIMFFYYVNYTISTKEKNKTKKKQSETIFLRNLCFVSLSLVCLSKTSGCCMYVIRLLCLLTICRLQKLKVYNLQCMLMIALTDPVQR